MAYPIAKYIVPPIFRLWIKDVEGTEHIPRNKAFIIAANHQSYFETIAIPCIVCPITNTKIHFFINRKYLKNFFLKWLLLSLHRVIPVAVGQAEDKEKVNENAFKQALSYLKNNEPVGIYPEGHIDVQRSRMDPGVDGVEQDKAVGGSPQP